MKTRPFGVRAIAAAASVFAIAVVTVPLVSSPAGADTAPPSGPASMSVAVSSPTASYAAVGDAVTYRFVVTNSGAVPLANVGVTATLSAPAGTAAQPMCQSVSGGGSCAGAAAGTLPPGATATFGSTYVVSQKDLDNGEVVASASATGTDPSGATISATANRTNVPAQPRPAVSLQASASVPGSSDGRYVAGQTVTFSSLVANTGNVTLSPVTVSDAKAGLSPVSCPVSSLAPGSTETCTAGTTATTADVVAGSLTDAATVTGTPPQGAPVTATSSATAHASVTANSSTTATTSSAPAVQSPSFAQTRNLGQSNGQNSDQGQGQGQGQPPGQGPQGSPHPSIALTKSATVENSPDGRFSAAGQTVDYAYRVTNTGNVSLDPVTLHDPMTGLTDQHCPATTLAPGASEICTATYTVSLSDIDAGSITNTATVTGTPTCGGPDVWASSSATVYGAPQPSISLMKSATVEGSSDNRYSAAGQTVDYSYLITNTGNVTLNPVTLHDPKPGLTGLQCPDTALFPGIAELCTASYTTTQADVDAGSITNTATAAGTPACGPKVWATSSATVYGEKAPAIALEKTATVMGSADNRYSAAGQTVDYAYRITNTGNVTLDPVTLSDPKPGLQDLVCPDTALASGASETCTASYKTTQADVDAGSITNTATATGTPPCGAPVTATSTATVYAAQTPSISVVKTADVPAVSAVGQSVLYTFMVTNTGNVPLHDVDVTDAQAAPSLDSSLGPITCTTGANGAITLAPGQSTDCSASYTVTKADLSHGSVTDTVTATGHPPCGPPVTATSTLTLPVTQITVTKAVNLTTIVAGSAAPIVYTITVTNTGTATTSDPIVVTDAAPTGTTLVAGSPACATGGPPSCSVATNGAGTITWTIASGVAPGASYTLTYAVTLDPTEVGGDTVVNTATWTGPSCSPPSAPCSSNQVTTTVTAAPVTKPVTPPAAVQASAPGPTPPSAPPVIAFTGAYLSREAIVGLAAVALGTAIVALTRRRRRTPRGTLE